MQAKQTTVTSGLLEPETLNKLLNSNNPTLITRTLAISITEKNYDVIAACLTKKPNLHDVVLNNYSPLDFAVEVNDPKILELLKPHYTPEQLQHSQRTVAAEHQRRREMQTTTQPTEPNNSNNIPANNPTNDDDDHQHRKCCMM